MMEDRTLIEFPCSFPIKVIGSQSLLFREEVKTVLLKHIPHFDFADLSYNQSKEGKYLSITATVVAESQAMLDAIYQDLNQLPDVKMVL